MRWLRLFVVLCLVCLLLSVSTSANAIRPDEPTPRQSIANATTTRLLEQAERDGHVRVIVQLRLPHSLGLNAPLTSAEAAERQAAIATSQRVVLTQLAPTSTRVVRQFQFIPAMALDTDAAGLRQMIAMLDVEAIQADGVLRPTLDRTSALVGATTAWESGYSGAGQTIALIDTGVDATHPFLSGKVVAEACFSSPILAGSSFCPNGQPTQIGAGTGRPCLFTNIFTACWHGTFTAGVAAGRGSAFSGIAKDATIISIQVFHLETSQTICTNSSNDPTPCVIATWSDVIAGLEYIYSIRQQYAIPSIVVSVGGGCILWPL